MRLVVGLGNPGEEYANTPHNLGFLAVDRLAETHSIRVRRKDSRALVGVGEIGGCPVMLAKPQTFMNLSGTSVKPLMEAKNMFFCPKRSTNQPVSGVAMAAATMYAVNTQAI